jgi:hypothetical protein
MEDIINAFAALAGARGYDFVPVNEEGKAERYYVQTTIEVEHGMWCPQVHIEESDFAGLTPEEIATKAEGQFVVLMATAPGVSNG